MDPQLQSTAVVRLRDSLEGQESAAFASHTHFPSGNRRPHVSGQEYLPPRGRRAISITRLSRKKEPPWRFRVQRSWVEFTPITYRGRELPQIISMSPGDALYVQIGIRWTTQMTTHRQKVDSGVIDVPVWYKKGPYRVESARMFLIGPGEPVPAHEFQHYAVYEQPEHFGFDAWSYYCGAITEHGTVNLANGLQGHVFFPCGRFSVLPIFYP